MKKFLLSLALALVAFAASATVGETFTNGNLVYKITAEPTSTSYGTLTVTGLTSMAQDIENLALTIPTSVRYREQTYVVKSVSPSACASNKNISSVTIEYGVTSLAEKAFYNCPNITTVRIPSSCRLYSQVFTSCIRLRTVYYNTLTDVTKGSICYNDAFPNNTNMTLYVPKISPCTPEQFKKTAAFQCFTTVEKTENARDVFCSDGALLVVTKAPTFDTHGEMTMIGFSTSGPRVVDGAFKKYSTYSSNPTPYYTFGPYTYDFVAIADSAMLNNTSLKSVDLTSCTKLTSIGKHAFKGCTALSSVQLEEGLTTIDHQSFQNCTSLKSISIPASVTACNQYFVDGCTALTSINVDPNNKNYTSFSNMLYFKSKNTLLRCPEGYNSSITFPAEITTIGAYAFENCSKLLSILVPYGVTAIHSYAFFGCSTLSVVAIPSSVNSLNENAFRNCPSLANLFVNRATPPTMLSTSFNDCKRTNLFVPQNAVNAYMAAEGWKTWGSVKRGAYDGFLASITTSSGGVNCFYSITSAKAETINGKSYAGRASLVNVPSTSSTATLTIPAYVAINGKNYAVTSVGAEAAVGASFSGDFTVNLGENVDTIFDKAFYNHTSIKTLNLNANLKYLGVSAFDGCRIANNLNFPYGFKYLGNRALYDNSMERILLPSSFSTMGTAAIAKNNHLTNLIVNKDWLANYTNWDLTNIPSTCKLYVPTGCVQQYKNNSQWGKLNVMAGAYDFTFNNGEMNSTRYHMTVTSNVPVTVDGVTYAGKAKYVYHPAVAAIQATLFIGSNAEKNVTNGANKSYLMTEFGDSLLVGAASASDVRVSDMKYLERIGDYALYGTGITTFTVPASCKSIGKNAFVNCRSLTELFLTKSANGVNWNGQFYGLNASGFKCYVHWTNYPSFKNSIKNWTKYTGETDSPTDRLNGYLQITGDNTATSFSIDHPVDWNATGLKAFAINGYGSLTNLVYTQPVYSTPAGTGLLVEGFQKNQIYKLIRPASNPSTPTNFLKGTATGIVDVFGETVGFLFDNSQKYFWKPTSTYKLNVGYAYLVLPSNLVGSTTRINVDRWQQGLKGDVDGDGVVNVSDVTALINKILGTASYSDSVCDIDGNGTVNVSDVTALINLILG